MYSCIHCTHAALLIKQSLIFVLFFYSQESIIAIFARERLREAGVPGLNMELIKEIPSLWKALSDHEKQVHINNII